MIARTGILKTGFRVLLSIAVVGAFLVVLVILNSMREALSGGLRGSGISVQHPAQPFTARMERAPAVFWPRFPRNTPPNARSTLINGVEILTEDWKSSSAPREILSYYRTQMTARGWRDVTEDTYGLRPESRGETSDQSGLQDQKYLTTYRDVMDSNLVLSRGPWSMHVMTESRQPDAGGTTVKIVAAATPSLKDFSAAVASAVTGKQNAGQTKRAIDSVERHGGQRYHTVVDVKNQEPAKVFEEAITDFRARNWRPITQTPSQPGSANYFAWLVKDRSYAALSVAPLPKGQGTSITRTEVTPE